MNYEDGRQYFKKSGRYLVYNILILVAFVMFYLKFQSVIGDNSNIDCFKSIIAGYIYFPFSLTRLLDTLFAMLWVYFSIGPVRLYESSADNMIMLFLSISLGSLTVYLTTGYIEAIIILCILVGIGSRFAIPHSEEVASQYVGFGVGISFMASLFYGFISGLMCYALYIVGLGIYMIYDFCRTPNHKMNKLTKL